MNLNATFFGQMISFYLFVWFCMKYVWPVILSNIKKRKKKIKKSFENIKLYKKKIKIFERNIMKKKKKTKNYINNLIKEAYQEKNLILENTKNEINNFKKKSFKNIDTEIKIIYNNAHQKLIKEIKKIVILMTKKVIKKSINIEQHNQYIDKLIKNFRREKYDFIK